MLIYIRNFGSSEFNGTGPASKKTAKRCFLSFSLKLRSNVKQKIFSAFDVAAADEKTIIFSLWMNEMNGDEFRLKRNWISVTRNFAIWTTFLRFGKNIEVYSLIGKILGYFGWTFLPNHLVTLKGILQSLLRNIHEQQRPSRT